MFQSYKEKKNGQKLAALIAFIVIIIEKNRFLRQNLDEKWVMDSYGVFT